MDDIRSKLDGIVGLNDNLLIELRSRLLTAMKAGEASEIAVLSKAIGDRETALSGRLANDALKRADIRVRIAEKRRQALEEELAASKQSPAQNENGRSGNGQNDVAKGLKDASNTVAAAANAASTVKESIDMARSIFGF